MEERIYEINPENGLRVKNDTSYLLMSISKWTKFLSILGFIFLGLMAVCVLLMGAFLSSFTNYADITNSYMFYAPGVIRWFHILIYLVVLLVYFFPFYFLYQFSIRIKKAINTKDEDIMTNAFMFLQKHFMYLGVLAIIGLIFFAISFVGMILTFFAYL